LRHHFLVMNNRAGNKLGKKGHKQAVMGEVVLLGLAIVGVDKVGNLLEGKKGNCQRQNDRIKMEIGPSNGIDIVYRKIGVFVESQQRQIENDS